MRKEILWAAVIGITFGLIIAFGIFRINSSLKSKNPTSQRSPSPKTVSEFKIALDKPENNDVVTESLLTVSGITKPLVWVTVSGEDNDYITQADEQGVFSQDVDLNSGVNQIKITAFDPQGNQSIEKVLVVYSSAFQPRTDTGSAPSDSATSDSAIRLKVQEKVSLALNKPKAYIGVVTDITAAGIQIKTTDSEIKQISTSSDLTTVVRMTGTSSKTVKLTDIAIGDFIVAMGYINVNSVLSAQRVLITSPITEPKVNASYGKVTAVSKTLTVVSLKSGQEENVTPNTKTDIESFAKGTASKIKFTGIAKDDLVVYVTSQATDSVVLRAIFQVHPL